MAIFKKAEFASFCGVSRAHVSVAITRGKIIVQNDGMIDSENELNRLYKATASENAVRRGQGEKVPETSGKPPKEPKKQKESKPRADPRLKDRLDKKFDLEIEERQAKINKAKQEAQMTRLKEMKLTGQLIPTDLVYGTIRQLSQSILMSFKNQVDAMVTDLSKVAKLDRKGIADLRKTMREHLNHAVNNAVDEAQKNVENITSEYSQEKKAA